MKTINNENFLDNEKLPSLLLIVDLETTGLNPKIDHVIELGAILYSVKNHTVVQQFSTTFPVNTNPAEKINQIGVEVSQLAINTEFILSLFQSWVEKADYLVAHNADFDRQWFGSGVLPKINKPWLCTYQDFIWKKNKYPTKLVNIAESYGIDVSNAHRALADCQMIAELLSHVAIEEGSLEMLLRKAIRRNKEETVIVVAEVNYHNRNLAKEHHFLWNAQQKYWFKKLKTSDYHREVNNYPFETYLEQCIETKHSEEEGLDWFNVKLLFDQASSLYQLKKYKEAIDFYDRIISLDSVNLKAWYKKGMCLHNLERYEEAIVAYEMVVEINSKHLSAWLNRGHCHYNLKRYEQAIYSYKKALSIDPNRASIWCNLGMSIDRTTPDLLRYRDNDSILQEHTLECSQSMAAYNQAIKIDPNHLNSWHNKGLNLLSLEMYEEAICCFDKVISIDNSHAAAWYNRGLALERIGRYTESRSSFEKAKTLGLFIYSAT